MEEAREGGSKSGPAVNTSGLFRINITSPIHILQC